MEEVLIKCEPLELKIEPDSEPETTQYLKKEPEDTDHASIDNTEVPKDCEKHILFIKQPEIEHSENTGHEGTSKESEIIGKVYENGKINRLTCTQCNKTYKNRACLKSHIKFVHSSEESIVECKICYRTFKSVMYLRSHMSSVHAKTEEVHCEQCNKMFLNKKKLSNHIYFAHPQPGNEVTCNVCSKTYKSAHVLKTHMRHVHPEGDPHPCPFCYKTFKSDMLLQRHMKWAHPEDGMIYKCQECNKVLPSIEGYKIHIKNVHSFNRATCNICKRSFKTKKSLDRHLKNIHGNENKEIKPFIPTEITCVYCERMFSNNTSLYWHIEKYHANNVPKNFCTICNKDFSDNASLQRHLTSVHSLETATCNICLKEFKSAINLQNHIRITHAPPEATQHCDICQKTFKCPLHLRMHVLAVHSEGEFPCDICNKTFTSTKYLNKHKKTHIESRDHECDICHKMYKSIHAVNKHKKQVHNGVRCAICNIKQPDINDHIRKCHPEITSGGLNETGNSQPEEKESNEEYPFHVEVKTEIIESDS